MEFSLVTKQSFKFGPRNPGVPDRVERMATLAISAASGEDTANSGESFVVSTEDGQVHRPLFGGADQLRVYLTQLSKDCAKVKVCFKQPDNKEKCWALLGTAAKEDITLKVVLDLGVKGKKLGIRVDDIEWQVERILSAEEEYLFHLRKEEVWGVIELIGDIPEALQGNDWVELEDFGGEISVICQLSGVSAEEMNKMHLNSCVEEEVARARTVIQETSAGEEVDVVLVAENDAEVKCHQKVLSVHSPVFRAWFESNQQESESSYERVVPLKEMSEEGVGAMVAYLYSWDITRLLENCVLALELLLAGEKYKIDILRRVMFDMILLKPEAWFTTPMTVKLFHFGLSKVDVVEVEEGKMFKALVEKAVAVLKSKPKEEVMECSDFQQLFQDSQAAKQLCSYLLFN